MILSRLVLANFSSHRIRFALTVAAIALSVSLVVAVTSGYACVEGTGRKYLAQYMGTTDITVTPADYHGVMTAALIDVVRRQPEVKKAIGRYETQRGLVDIAGKDVHGRLADVIGLRRPEDDDVDALPMEAGTWFNSATGDEAVIDQVAANFCRVKVGDWLTIPDISQPIRVKIVGIVHKPGIIAEMRQTIYLPIETAQALDHREGKLSRILIDVRKGVDAQAFAKRLQTILAATEKGVRAKAARDTRQTMEKNLEMVHLVAYLGGAVSMLAATFIVFSALSMGVTERSRTLAMLRAIGALRGQLVRLVIIEGICLALAGVVIGIPLGCLWIKLLSLLRPGFFYAGIILSWGGILLGSVGSIVAAILAAILPAWSAARVSPLQALTPLAVTPSRTAGLWVALPGLALACVDPLLVFTTIASPTWRYRLHLALGLPSMMLGFFLMAPLFVRVTEWLFAWIAARLLAIEPVLLRQQLSGGLWRSAGTASSLMVGLAVLIVMQVQGHSALAAWRLPNKFPDMFIRSPAALDEEQQKIIQHLPGINSKDFLPIAYTAATIDFDSSKVARDLWPPATMIFGMDPDTGGRMIDMEFRDDNGHAPATAAEHDRLADRATAILHRGRAMIITDEFRQLYGLKVGDKLGVHTVENGVVPYTVAGIVWSPGIDVLVNMFDMGQQFDEQTASTVFIPMADLKRDFGIDRVSIFAVNVAPGLDKKVILREINGKLANNTRSRSKAAPPKPATTSAALPSNVGIIGLLALKAKELANQGQVFITDEIAKMGLRAGDVRKIKADISEGFDRLLLFLSTIAFAAMAVASLGVANTVLASVRTRRWQFGILRSIGVTRGQMLRLVVAESLLLGVVACALGLAAGFEMSLNANGLTRNLLGYTIPIVPPWGIIGVGVAIVMFVSLAASLVPAISLARSQPLDLLQAGRAAA